MLPDVHLGREIAPSQTVNQQVKPSLNLTLEAVKEDIEFPDVDLGTSLDSNALAALKYSSDDKQALAVACKHMESMFVQQMFTAMRSTSEAFASEENPLTSTKGGVFQDFLDQQMVLGVSKGGSFGLAETMYKQMMR